MKKTKMIPEFRGEEDRVEHEWTGTLQANGALILLAKPSDVAGWIVVMAKFRDEYVVWNMCEDTQEFQSGRYFKNCGDATESFKGVR